MSNHRRKPTIRDVAARAGVSITTVSHALSGARPVHAETATLIWQIADELGYRPSRLATQLRKGRTGNLGLILPDMGNESFTAVARAIHDAAFSAGFHLLIRNSDESLAEEQDAVHSFLADDIVDGIILIATHGDHSYLDAELRNGARIVATNRPVGVVDMPQVARDDEGSAYAATRHLLALGHQRIGVLAGRQELLSSQQRISGVRRALTEAGLPHPLLHHTTYVPSDDPHADARAATLAIMQERERPTALITLSQRFLEGAVLALRELTLDCPDDVALLSYGRSRLAAVMHPVPTVIDQDALAFGKASTRLLLEWLETGIAPIGMVLPPRYVLGDTCGWRRFAPAHASSVFVSESTSSSSVSPIAQPTLDSPSIIVP